MMLKIDKVSFSFCSWKYLSR